MKMRRMIQVFLVAAWTIVPPAAYGQSDTTGAIAGTVKDDTGAVLPGVTVEAASPALIEKVRSVVTDDQGNYKIVDLRPGPYTVTFILTGFSTFRRDGIELRTAFTATVNAEMKVGALEETITVSGAAPIVDVQNVRTENVLSRQLLDTLPNAQTLQAFASVIVGTTVRAGSQDVGGNRGELFSSIAIHGGRAGDMKMMMDGMSFNKGGDFGGGVRWYQANQLSTQEVVLQTGGSMESETGGVQMNLVPKEGGNVFRLTALGNYTGENLQSSNINDEIRARGQNTPSDAIYVYDTGVGFGGPVREDKLWFYTGQRSWGSAQHLGGASRGFYNLTQDSFPPVYTPDYSRPTYRKTAQRDHNLRLTWQAAPRHKVNVAFYYQKGCTCFAQVEGKAPEAARHHIYYPNNVAQATWNHPRTNRLLFEAAAGWVKSKGNLGPPPDAGVKPDHISIQELSTGLTYRSINTGTYGIENVQMFSQRASMSYVTGSHAWRIGTSAWEAQSFWLNSHYLGNVHYTFRNGIPVSLTQWATPYDEKIRTIPNLGLYVSDQWTVRGFTFNGGVRYDYVNARALAVHRNASTYVGEADFPEVKNLPNWKDVSVRTGGAYDVFGTGRTAIKVSLGKYLAATGLSVAQANSPVTQTVKSATRTWNDANGDYSPQENELGPLSNANFGRQVITSRWAPDLLEGWGKREYNWQGMAAVQHELRSNLGVNIAYFRTWYGNFRVSDNLAVTPANYDPYCIMAPVDARLPMSGQQVCGFYDIKPAQFGLVDTLVVQAENFGRQTEVYNGVDFTVNARFGRGGHFQGGLTTGRTVTDNCDVIVDSPDKRFCRQVEPWRGQTQVKLSASYPLPWNLQTSGVFQLLPGIPILASHVVPNAQVAPSLGRNLGACRGAATCNGTVTVDLIEPGTLYEKRLKQLDLRLSRRFRMARGNLMASFDVYNVFNGVDVLSMTTRYGPAWLEPVEVLGPRMFKFGAQYDF